MEQERRRESTIDRVAISETVTGMQTRRDAQIETERRREREMAG